MSARVKVRAAIWVQDRLVVHRTSRLGNERVTLPGGWVGQRESVTDALARELHEELGITVELGDLLFAAEVLNSSSRQDIELIFAAMLPDDVDTSSLSLVDPSGPEADRVLPPVVNQLVSQRKGAADVPARWLGNLYLTNHRRP